MSLRETLLVRRLKERDERAFQDFVRTYKDKVYNLVYRILGHPEEARDVAQEVFITVFKSIDSFRGDAQLSTWLYRIAANQCKNRLKYLSRRSYKATDELNELTERMLADGPASATTPHVDGPEKVFEGLELERLVQQGLALLDEDHRMLIVLRDVENLAYDEIAAVTGLAEGTVKSRLHRGRLQLKEYLAKHLGGDP